MASGAGGARTVPSSDDLLVLFGRVPSLGTGFKEITDTHGPQAAYRLQRILLDICLKNAGALHVRKWFRYPAGTPAPSLGPDWSSGTHEPGTVGEIVSAVLREGFNRGFQRIVVFYADCPSLVPDILESAFEALEEEAEVVLGPTYRGGIYLVGARRKAADLFALFPGWSTSQLFDLAKQRVEASQLTLFVLPRMQSVETLDDWKNVSAEGWIPGPPTVTGGTGRPEG